MEDLAHAGVRFLVAAGERRVSGRRRLAVMFDIDDTLIEYTGRVIQPIVELAKLSKRLDFVVVIITARPPIPETMHWTAMQLEAIGVEYNSLVFAPAQEKTHVKMMLPYEFVLSVGDQLTDLGMSRHWINTATREYA